MENTKLFDRILKDRKGRYCHVIEVEDSYALEGVVEDVIDAYGTDNYTKDDYIAFFESIGVYYLGENEEDEEDVYRFSFSEAINNMLS